MNGKKFLSLLLAALLAITVLTGCGQAQPTPTAVPAPEAPAAEAPAVS